MKDLCAWLVSLVMMVFAFRYAYQIWRRQISPTLSTWIIFLLGTGLSLATYAIAERHDFRSGVLNLMDVVAIMIVFAVALACGKRNVRFKPFEKWYLGGIVVIIVYGLLTGDAWRSNVFTQVLMGIGYIPTIQNMITERKNTESFTGWSLCVIGGVLALYPALVDGNSLAALYAIRLIVLASLIIVIMAYYELRSKKVKT